MAQLVFEFVSHELDTVVTAIKRIVGETPKSCEIARTFLEYKPCAIFEEAISIMRMGEAVSAVLRPEVRNVRYVLINKPFFNGTKLPGWLGTIEYTGMDYKRIWDELLGVQLQLACLGNEEGVPLDAMEQLVSTEFPWEAPELVIGAARDNKGEWDIRHGSNYFAPR